jgi:ElaB/YqjD/DUF883 family membrane-anchored ribosome-binding protein
MKSPNTKSSDELKREVHQELRRVERDIDALQGRLTPGQFLDDAIFYRRERSLGATFDHLKRNPIGTTFLSLGTIMLMEDENRRSMEQVMRNKASTFAGTVRDSVHTVGETVRGQLPHREAGADAGPGTVDRARDKIHQLKDTVQSKVRHLRGTMQEQVDDVKGKISDVQNRVQDKFASSDSARTGDESNFSFDGGAAAGPGTGERIPGKIAGAREKLSGIFEEGREKISSAIGQEREKLTSAFDQGRERASTAYGAGRETIRNMDPITYMALGAGLGALTGMALPLSEKESEFVEGRFSDRLSSFNDDLEAAVNECSNILKDLVIQDVKDFNVSLFK